MFCRLLQVHRVAVQGCYAPVHAASAQPIVKIRSRLLWLVFVAWLPSALAIAVVARSAYVEQKKAVLADVQKAADSLGSIVERELDKRFVMARTLSSSSSLQTGQLEPFYGEALRATRGTESWVLLLTRTHQVLNTIRPYARDFAVPMSEGEPWMPAGENIYFSMSGPVVKKPVLGVVAVQAPSASPVRYGVAVAFDPAVLQALVKEKAAPHYAVVAVMDKNLRVMARSKNPERWLGRSATGPLVQRALARKSGFESSITLDNVPSLTYLSQPNRYGWYAVIALPTASLNEQARKAAIDAVSLAGILLGLSLLFALYVARSIGEPILALKDAADALVEKRVPAPATTGLFEADQVSKALHEAGLHARESAEVLEARVSEAVARTAEVQVRLAEAQKREAVGRLAGGVAHDFNNLLQTISAAHHLLQPNVPEGPPRRILEAASRATGKATNLVKQMLSFGRAHTLEPEAVDINDFLLKISELTSKAAGANVSLRAQVDPGLAPVFVDPSQFELALLNVIFNARDAMAGGGHIDIRAALVDAAETGIPEAAHAQYVRLDVCDDGPGMAPETLQKAFEPYFTTKPVGAGSGLGLAQVLAFARQSGGDARITSALGTGTVVRLFLPVTAQQAAAPQESATGHEASGRALRVLMVEDDPLVASVVVPAIEGAGHSVTHCLTADDAKALLQRGDGPFDVLFSDVVMPGSMTGFDLAKWCEAAMPGLPVVLATGYSAQAPQSEVNRLLKKPYHLLDLLKSLDQAAEHRAL